MIIALKGVRSWSTSSTRHDYALVLPVEMVGEILSGLAKRLPALIEQ